MSKTGHNSVDTVDNKDVANVRDVFGDTTTPDVDLITRAEAQGLQVQSMLELIPEGGGDELGFLRSIFAATDLSGIDAPWTQLDGMRDYFGRQLAVWSVKRVKSDFTEGLGWFFVLDCQVVSSGEKVTLSTGSTTAMAQIMKAWSLGVRAFTCVPTQAKNPTSKGYYPYHLEQFAAIPQDNAAA